MIKILVFLLLPFTVLSQGSSKSFDAYMRAQAAVNHFNGNVLVARSGNVLYQKAFGYSNYNSRELLGNNSVFELASVSKQFTAMGILMLVEKGKIALTDTLRKYFPELPYSNVTIQNLLTHTSGLPDYMDAMDKKWNHKNIAFNSDMIQFLAEEKIPANFKPNAKWQYSNTAYAMLASIIEKVSGISYSEFMHKNIFLPLGMTRSRVYNTRRSKKEVVHDYAFGFVYSDSLKEYAMPDSLAGYDEVFYLDGIQGDGTINSTTGDLLKWDRALKNHTLLSETTQSNMFLPQSLIDTLNNRSYGYGVFLGKNKFGNFISHSGSWAGYRTVLTRYLQNDGTIIILSNNESDVSGISNAVAAILFNQEVILPYLHKEIKADSAALNHYLGHYTGYNMDINITRKDGNLYCNRKGLPDIILKPESNTKLFYGDGSDRQFEFKTDEHGNVTRAWSIANGVKTEINKVQER